MTSGFTVYYIALDTQSQMLDNQQIIADTEVRKVQEKFGLSVTSDSTDSYRLSVQVSNQGPYTLEIADIWIVNKTLPTQPANKTDIAYFDSFIPVGYGGNILANTPLYMVPDTYDIKVISTLGTIRTVEFDVLGGSNLLRADMYAIPPDVNIGENATIALYVTNVGEATITSLSPSALTLDPPTSCALLESPPVGTTTLIGAETKFFTWQCQISGSVGSKVTFSADASGNYDGGPITSNTASDKVQVQIDNTGSGETIVITEDLFSKPEIFPIFPGPFGEDESPPNDLAIWGVNVANPTDAVMNVTKVVITTIDPQGGGGFNIFTLGCNDQENISPWGVTGTGDWACSIKNQIRWLNVTNPIQIPPRSVYPFLVKAETGGIANVLLDSMPIQVTVVTSAGQFGKAGFDSSMDGSNGEVFANVFLGNGLGTLNNNNINSSRTDVLNNTATTFDFWLADFDTSASTWISGESSGDYSTLIINIPQGWTLPGGAPPDDANWRYQYSGLYPDTSSQLVAVLKTNIGDQGTPEGAKVTIIALAPVVSETKMYVFHVLGNGITSNGFSVSPLMQMVVQVCGTPACT